MKALSIHQPWAWAILHAGKVVENRTWATTHRGPLLVHAAKSRASYDREKAFDWREIYGTPIPSWEELITGAVVGVVDVVACLRAAEAPPTPWAEGPWCWVLANPRPLADPVPFRGAQLLFDVPDHLLQPAG